MSEKKIYELRERRKKRMHFSIRRNPNNQEKLRLCICRSERHLFMQLIDDKLNNTVCSFSTQQEEFKKNKKEGASYNVKGAESAGIIAGEKLKIFLQQQNSKKICVDLGGKQFAGRIKVFLSKIREINNEWSF